MSPEDFLLDEGDLEDPFADPDLFDQEGDLEDIPDPLAEAVQPMVQTLEKFMEMLAQQTADQQKMLAAMNSNTQALARALDQMAQAMSRPKTIRRGPDGRAIGIE